MPECNVCVQYIRTTQYCGLPVSESNYCKIHGHCFFRQDPRTLPVGGHSLGDIMMNMAVCRELDDRDAKAEHIKEDDFKV